MPRSCRQLVQRYAVDVGSALGKRHEIMLTTYHQLGRVVVSFQHVDHALAEVILLLAGGDEETVRILIHDLGYMQRVRAASTLFTRFVDLRSGLPADAKQDFYALLALLEKLGQRRNELVHSRYVNWRPLGGGEALLRTKARRPQRGPATEIAEEEMLVNSFEGDLLELGKALMLLENARLNIVDWLYPEA